MAPCGCGFGERIWSSSFSFVDWAGARACQRGMLMVILGMNCAWKGEQGWAGSVREAEGVWWGGFPTLCGLRAATGGAVGHSKARGLRGPSPSGPALLWNCCQLHSLELLLIPHVGEQTPALASAQVAVTMGPQARSPAWVFAAMAEGCDAVSHCSWHSPRKDHRCPHLGAAVVSSPDFKQLEGWVHS